VFSSRANAERLVRQLEGHGLAAHVVALRSGQKELFRVRVGPAADRPGALALLARVKAAGAPGAVLAAASQAPGRP
jgi:cell division septation protein DedD